MNKKEELLKEIEDIKEQIKTERSFNENNGTISFLQWQLHCAKEELKELEKNEK